MNTKRAIIAILLATVATIVCIIGSQEEEPVPKKTIKLVFMQEHTMVDMAEAEPYVSEKIDTKRELIERQRPRNNTRLILLNWQGREELHRLLKHIRNQLQNLRVPLHQMDISEHIAALDMSQQVMPESGVTIASNSLPMGTRVYIEGIGERVVQDTGGMDVGTLDIFCNSVDECYAITGNYDVYIIEE